MNTSEIKTNDDNTHMWEVRDICIVFIHLITSQIIASRIEILQLVESVTNQDSCDGRRSSLST